MTYIRNESSMFARCVLQCTYCMCIISQEISISAVFFFVCYLKRTEEEKAIK